MCETAFYKIALYTKAGYIDCIAELCKYDYELLKRNLNRGIKYYNTIKSYCLKGCCCEFCMKIIVETIEEIDVKFEMNEWFIIWLVRNLKDIMIDIKCEGTTCYDYDLPFREYIAPPEILYGYDLVDPPFE